MDNINNALSHILPPLTLFDGTDIPPPSDDQNSASQASEQANDKSAETADKADSVNEQDNSQADNSADTSTTDEDAQQASDANESDSQSNEEQDTEESSEQEETEQALADSETADSEDDVDQDITDEQSETPSVTVTIIDHQVADHDILVTEAQERGDHVIVVEENNTIEDITDQLVELDDDIDTINIVAHSDQNGSMKLGADKLNPQSYELHQSEFMQWNSLLSEQADIVFYSCNTTETAEGQAMIEQIATDTGADVAASDDRIAIDADSNIFDVDTEYHTGMIDATNIFNMTQWSGALNIIYVDTFDVRVIADAYTSLREAINMANGTTTPTTIVLEAGTYEIKNPYSIDPNRYHADSGLPTIKSNTDITIIGQGKDSTTIKRSDDPGTLDFRIFQVGEYRANGTGGTNTFLSLENLTVANGKLGVMNTVGMDPKTGNDVELNDQEGGNIVVRGQATLETNNVIIKDGQAESGGGVALHFKAGGTFTNTDFIDNKAISVINPTKGYTSGDGGGLMDSGDGPMFLENLTFQGNQADGTGGGIHSEDQGNHELSNAIFTSNTAVKGGGIYIQGDSNVAAKANNWNLLENLQFYENEAYDTGSAIAIEFGRPNENTPLINNIIAQNNITSDTGGTLHFDNNYKNVKDVIEITQDFDPAVDDKDDPATFSTIDNNIGNGITVTNHLGTTPVELDARVLIHSNTQLAIDLNRDGVTLDDPDDVDVGANSLVNTGELDLAIANVKGTEINITGDYQGLANAEITIHVYSSVEPDPTMYGEGEFYLGEIIVTTDGNGDAKINSQLELSKLSLEAGAEYITMRSTVEQAGVKIGTSEYSNAIEINYPPVAVDDPNGDPDDPIDPDDPSTFIGKDCYEIDNNMQLNVSAEDGILPNDYDPDGDKLFIVTVGEFKTAQGGTIDIAKDGSFTYTPPPGFVGTDYFQYTITDTYSQASAVIVLCVANAPVELQQTIIPAEQSPNRHVAQEEIEIDRVIDFTIERIDPAAVHVMAQVNGLENILIAQTDDLSDSQVINRQVSLNQVDLVDGIDIESIVIDNVTANVANLSEFNTLNRIDAQINAQIGTSI